MASNKKYTCVADLLTDDGFLAWHFETDAEQKIAWHKWMAEDPEHERLAKEAVNLIDLLLSPAEKNASKEELDGAFERLLKKLAGKGKSVCLL